jgi:hypothetical protein
MFSDKDLHGFILVLALYLFNPRSPREIRAGDIAPDESVEFVVNDLLYSCRECSTNPPLLFKTKPIFDESENERKPSFDKGL